MSSLLEVCGVQSSNHNTQKPLRNGLKVKLGGTGYYGVPGDRGQSVLGELQG